jgi:hypothetical protein
MLRTGPAYERPSRVSLALYVCFSLAVAVMAGWLVMMILSSNDANTKAADPTADRAADAADVAALAATSAPQVQNVLPSDATPAAASAGMPPAPADGAPWPDALQASPLASGPAAPGAPSAPFAAPSAAGASAAAPAAPETSYRGPGNLLDLPPDAGNAVPAAVPLPPPRPRRTASVPVPRPRQPIDGSPQAAQEPTLFDILVGRQP